jgi:hypothetical protein
MAEVNKNFVTQNTPKPAVGWFATPSWVSNLVRLKSGLSPFIGKRVILYALITLVVFGVFLFGGVGITVYAAASSLPGDATYPLKTTFESARAGLTIDSAAKARLYLDFAGRRLPEMQSLIDDGRYGDIAQAASEFERDIQMALGAVENLSRTDPARAAALNMEISTILRKYSNVLTQLLATVPMDVQPVIRNAIDAAQSTTGGGDFDNGVDNGNGDSGSNPRPTPSIIPTVTPIPEPSATPGKFPGGDDDGGNDDDANGSGGGNSRDDDGDDDDGGDDDGGDDNGGDD